MGGRKGSIMKKSFLFGSTIAVLSQTPCWANYITQDFDHPETGKKIVLVVDETSPKNAYVVLYDPVSKKFYYEKVEKNKPTAPTAEKTKKHAKSASAPKELKENSQPAPTVEVKSN